MLLRLYELTIDNLNVHSYSDSIFFADKLVTLSHGHIAAVYLLGECCFRNADFKKVHSLFQQHKLLSHNISFQLLAARALLNNKQYEQCLATLELQLEHTYCNRKMESCRAFIKAQCYEAQENKSLAVEGYTEALRKDPTNVEAVNRLLDCQLIVGAQKEELLNALAFAPEDQWLRKIYLSKVREVEEGPPEEEVRKETVFETLVAR